MIVVKSNRYRDNKGDDGDYVYDIDNEIDFSFSLDFNYVQRAVDFGSFNSFSNFSTTNQQALNNLEFGMTFTFNRVVANLAFGYFPQISNSPENDTTRQTIGGYNFRYTYGKDLLRSKIFELTPEVGIERKNADNSLFGTPYYTEFYNPAFLLDGRLNFGMIFGLFELRGFVGYNYDVSKESWKQQKNIVADGPKTSYTGLYTGVGLSLRFSDKF